MLPTPPPIHERVAALRQLMAEQQLSALIVPSSDPHDSEYPAPRWKSRAWISGFDGSAGTAVITPTAAALWTDSRYHLQAAQQLADSPFVLMPEGLPDTPSCGQWLRAELPAEHHRIGIVADSATQALRNEIEAQLGRPLTLCADLFDTLWPDRPKLPNAPITQHEAAYYQHSAAQKCARILAALPALTSPKRGLLLSDLSEIAWTLNLRGADIDYNPLFYAYLFVTTEGHTLCTATERLSPEIAAQLQAQGVGLRPYESAQALIGECFAQGIALCHSPALNLRLFEQLHTAAAHSSSLAEGEIARLEIPSPVVAFRAVKDEAELRGFRQAMQADGVALVRFRRWLDETIAQGLIVSETEHSVGEKLRAFRAEHPHYQSLSFATIVGHEAQGAIVHYEPKAKQSARLSAKGLLLIDSGAQYTCGTTDITRTIALGALTPEQRHAYTLVLKGHIALSRAHFPEGTRGLQLDLAARYAMWQEGYDFGHGTGHGVGARLCVHEGPLQIRKDFRPCATEALRAGMVLSNEPGIYVAGQFGVRIENLLHVVPARQTPYGSFLRFDTLTLCPIDTAPILLDLLSPEELRWLNDYHAHVCAQLLPLLHEEADRQWLRMATAPLQA